jgi:hypothetical protein
MELLVSHVVHHRLTLITHKTAVLKDSLVLTDMLFKALSRVQFALQTQGTMIKCTPMVFLGMPDVGNHVGKILEALEAFQGEFSPRSDIRFILRMPTLN